MVSMVSVFRLICVMLLVCVIFYAVVWLTWPVEKVWVRNGTIRYYARFRDLDRNRSFSVSFDRLGFEPDPGTTFSVRGIPSSGSSIAFLVDGNVDEDRREVVFDLYPYNVSILGRDWFGCAVLNLEVRLAER